MAASFPRHVHPSPARVSTIETFPAPPPPGARFTLIIPTWNNLAFARLCVASVRKNSAFPHQIVLHVNDGSDGTLDWARAEGLAHSWSADNTGICFGVNAAASLARTDHVVYMNDDMYVCPGWDAALWRAVESTGHRRAFFSSTLIEPTGRNAWAFAARDFGDRPATFREEELLAAAPGLVRPDWSGASWPPNLVHRSLWELVGGYSIEFSPGFYSDPDFAMKLWRAGVREFRGVGASAVYHFGRKSTGRISPPSRERVQFARKWGVPSSFFYRKVLRMGELYTGPLAEMESLPGHAVARLRATLIGLRP